MKRNKMTFIFRQSTTDKAAKISNNWMSALEWGYLRQRLSSRIGAL